MVAKGSRKNSEYAQGRSDYEHCLAGNMARYYRNVATPEGRMQRILTGSTRPRAKARGIEFSITLDDVLPLPVFCPILGVRLNYNGRKAHKGYSPDLASVDRIDAKRGYVPGNVWVISARANVIKNDGTAEEHERIAFAMRRWAYAQGTQMTLFEKPIMRQAQGKK